MKSHFILYVSDQTKSTEFYTRALGLSPTLNVPGMTEFELGNECLLGLMPEAGAERLFGGRVRIASPDTSVSRAEVYLVVDDAEEYHRQALAGGAVEVSELEERDWGHRAAYSLDPDGHVLAFAELTQR
jgi:uncharacterized protein